MEQTPEGLAAAKAVREAAKRAFEEVVSKEEPQAEGSSKRARVAERPPPSCTHAVSLPKEFDRPAHEAALDPAVYGAWA